MKFCKKYEEYMQGQGQRQMKAPAVEFKKLKKILKRCRGEVESHQCPVCDGTFFPSLLHEMSAVVGFFNESAQKLREVHLASGCHKYLVWCRAKFQGSHVTLIEEGKDLVTYAIINAIAMRKILKKYDKIHDSKQGQAFKTQAQSMHIEILQSPWLSELMAFHINVRETKNNSRKAPRFFEGCSLSINDGKPSLTCQLFDSVKIEIDMTCSICLDTVFDPVSLTCGHILCYMCACKAASVTIIDGLKAADVKEKCPLCREARVYEGALHMEELNILLSRRCPEYWDERLQNDKIERVRQAKEYWEYQLRAFVGF